MNLVLQRDINAPADKIWQILAHDLAKIADWSTDVDESRELRKDTIRFETCSRSRHVRQIHLK